jgi:methyltransferase (TIGR00027 family)
LRNAVVVEEKQTGGAGGVDLTAIGMAAARAVEGDRPDRLFEDPFAWDFVSQAASEGLFPERPGEGSLDVWDAMAGYFALRTRFFDDFVVGACTSGCRQVVVLGAGLDTRAYRLPWPDGVRLLELDTPGVLGFKERVLSRRRAVARCQRVAVAVDLLRDWPAAVAAAGFGANSATAWLAEGLLRYLGPGGTTRLLEQVTSLSAGGSRLAAEYIGRQMLRDPEVIAAYGELNPALAADQVALWGCGEPESDPGPWLDRHGWRTERQGVSELARRHGRPVPRAFAAEGARDLEGLIIAFLSQSG